MSRRLFLLLLLNQFSIDDVMGIPGWVNDDVIMVVWRLDCILVGLRLKSFITLFHDYYFITGDYSMYY